MKLGDGNCEVCGDPRVVGDHSKCSQFKKENFKHKKPRRRKLNDQQMRYFSKNFK